jgi:hypothetical protein
MGMVDLHAWHSRNCCAESYANADIDQAGYLGLVVACRSQLVWSKGSVILCLFCGSCWREVISYNEDYLSGNVENR